MGPVLYRAFVLYCLQMSIKVGEWEGGGGGGGGGGGRLQYPVDYVFCNPSGGEISTC